MPDIRSFFGGGAVKNPSDPTVGPVAKPVAPKMAEEVKSDKSGAPPKSSPSEKENSVQAPSIASSSTDKDSKIAESKGDVMLVPEDVKALITWEIGSPVPYGAVTGAFEKISALSGRLDKESTFRRLFTSVVATTPGDLDAVVYLASNSVAAAFEGIELGIGDSLLVKAITESTGRQKKAVEQAYKEEGDLGTVALASKSAQKTLGFGAKPKPLTARYVLEQLRKIANTKGSNSQANKVNLIKGMMVKASGAEAKYIIRSLQGKLRIGVAQQTVMVALAHSFAIHPPPAVLQRMSDDATKATHDEEDGDKEGRNKKEKETEMSGESEKVGVDEDEDMEHRDTTDATAIQALLAPALDMRPSEARKLRQWGKLKKEEKCEQAVIAVKRAFSECPSSSVLVKALLTSPLYDLHRHCRLCPGIPVAPMLAKPTKEIGEVLKRLSGLAFTMEYKYDGERAQVHLLQDGSVRIFSRNSEDMTGKYPDLAEVMARAKRDMVVDCVVDAEVVAFDREENRLLSFQQLSTRKRKADGNEASEGQVKVALQGFDLLYLNGTSILPLPLQARREILRKAFTEQAGMFYFASGLDHVEDGDTAPIETFMQEACGAMCEGLMVKTLVDNASYEPSKRSLNWLKLKKDYIDGMGVCDSVDLVVMGGFHGRGKRTNVYGAYLMGCYDPESDEVQSVCKVGTGFKDEDLTRLTEKMRDRIAGGGSGKKPIQYRTAEVLYPDDWFEPGVVWELQAADLSKSSVHMGAFGKIDTNRGIGLRFPRFLRERDDKAAESATNAEQIADMYRSQGLDEGGNGGDGDDYDDDDDAL